MTAVAVAFAVGVLAVGCTSPGEPAALPHANAAAVSPALGDTPTPQIVIQQNGYCLDQVANWTTLDPQAVTITTLVTGHVLLQVDIQNANSVKVTKTIPIDPSPYAFDVPNVDPTSITQVTLYSQAADGSTSHCTVPKG